MEWDLSVLSGVRWEMESERADIESEKMTEETQATGEGVPVEEGEGDSQQSALPQEKRAASGEPSSPAELLGQVAGLMIASPNHKHFFLSDLEWLVVPPVMLRQCTLFRHQGRPVGYASWAYLSEEAENRIKAGHPRLRPDEWKGGDRLWLIDVVGPQEAQNELLKQLREKVFKGKKVKTLQPAPDGQGMAVVEW
ncbi:MAG: toxin-activating lysine-acyltransferase [Magnetococcales bacterium]|nr:toxin-activating lysine-acyltransferase [Magnetococcales bacterium]